MATTQLLEDVEVAGVRLGSGDGIEDADEFRLARLGVFDYFLDNRGVLVVIELSSSTALDQIVIVRTSDGDDVDSSGRLDGKGHDDAVGEGDVIRKDSRLVGGHDRVQSVSAVRRATSDQVNAVTNMGAPSIFAKVKAHRHTDPMTRSPFLKRFTLEPTSYTSPATSQPKTVGHCWTKTPASCM